MRAPAHIQWIVDAAGEDGALSFIESAGGQRIFIPHNSSGSEIEAVYGPDIARALSARYPGEAYEVPVCRIWRMRMYVQMGMTNNEIALRSGCSRRTVLRALQSGSLGERPPRRSQVDDRQTSFF